MALHLPTSIKTMPHREGPRPPPTTVSHTDRPLQTSITTFKFPDLELSSGIYVVSLMDDNRRWSTSLSSKCGVHNITSLVIQIVSKLESMKHVGRCLDFCIISPSFYNWLCLLLLCAHDSPSQVIRPCLLQGALQ